MNSDQVKSGVERAPHRSLLKADGYSDEQIRRPFVGVVNSFNEIAPGHVHLQTIARAVKDGVLAAGGTPMEFNTIGVCDGIAMGHKGMHFSLSSRELIADTIRLMPAGEPVDSERNRELAKRYLDLDMEQDTARTEQNFILMENIAPHAGGDGSFDELRQAVFDHLEAIVASYRSHPDPAD